MKKFIIKTLDKLDVQEAERLGMEKIDMFHYYATISQFNKFFKTNISEEEAISIYDNTDCKGFLLFELVR